MTQERWEKLKEIFGKALELPPNERETFVREAADDDPELLSELLRLLEESDRESNLLSRPAFIHARPLVIDAGPRFSPGAVLAGRFRIVRFIARGGMGEIYEAEDIQLGERVALKTIRRIAPVSEILALFKREVQLARRVTHPNVCRIFDLAQHTENDGAETILLLSMELLEGSTLAEHLRATGPLTFREALPIIEDIAAGLQAVHDAGIIHGDLKPSNVMLAARPGDSKPRAVVMDFGMALPATPNSSEKSTSRGGTPEYFAPEQADGGPVTPAADIYSFALMIADMLGVPRPARLKPDAERMPGGWARVLGRCLEFEPSRRYSRPAELATILRKAADRPKALRRTAAITIPTVAAGILAAIMLSTRPEASPGTASRMLFTEEDSVSVRSPSPDGRLLAMTSWDTGDLVIRDVKTGAIRRLTHQPPGSRTYTGAFNAHFSPDGRRIVFVWAKSRTESEVHIVDIDGTGERILYRNALNRTAQPLDWSPEGTEILVRISALDDPDQELAVMSPDDGAVQPIRTPVRAQLGTVFFGQNKNSIVFTARKTKNAGSEIHRLTLDGDDMILVSSASNYDAVIGWSPDRRRLLFSSDRRGRAGIWAIPISERGAEGDPQELVPDAQNWAALGVTQTGQLFYRHDADSIDVYTAELDVAGARTVSPPRPVMDRFVGSFAYPNWSEDGRQLLFGSTHDPRQPSLLIHEMRTGANRELPFNFRYIQRAQWVEHGAAIMALGETTDAVQGYFRIDPRTGAATLFSTSKDLDADTEGVWSSDGTTYFNRFSNFRRGIFRLNVATRERRVLYVPPPELDVATENLALSPDGRMLAFHARNDGAKSASLMLLAVEGGEPRTLLTIQRPEAFIFGSFTWTPDSKQILAVRTRDNRVSEIWRVPVDGSTPTRIDFPAMRIACLRLNPDGKTIAFMRPQWRSEIWILQNFL